MIKNFISNYTYTRGQGSYTIDIKWNNKTFNSMNKRLKRALKRAAQYSKDTMNEYYVPKNTGELIASSTLEIVNDNTIDIKWNKDYAANAYYNMEQEIEYYRGPRWFDRMIAVYSQRIIEEASKEYFR